MTPERLADIRIQVAQQAYQHYPCCDELLDHIDALQAENERMKSYEAQLESATKAMAYWTPAMGRNGLLNVAGHVEILVEDNEFLRAIVDKLPKYADTGEAFVPRVDNAWIIIHGKVEKSDAAGLIDGVWRCWAPVGMHIGVRNAYSTHAAAETAMEKCDG